MPTPPLLKRLSWKNLRKRSQSSTGSVDRQIEVPPLPVPIVPTAPKPIPLPNASPFLPPTDLCLDNSASTTPATLNGSISNGAPYYAPLVVGNAVPQDDFSKDLRGALASAATDPKVSKTDKALMKLGA
jgi:hypothetical protein